VDCKRNGCHRTAEAVQQLAEDMYFALASSAPKGEEGDLCLEGDTAEHRLYMSPVLGSLEPAGAWLKRLHLWHMVLSRDCLLELSPDVCPRVYHVSLSSCTLEVGALLGLLPLIHAREGGFVVDLHSCECYNRDVAFAADVALFCNQVQRDTCLMFEGIGEKHEYEYELLEDLLWEYPRDCVALVGSARSLRVPFRVVRGRLDFSQ